MIPMDLFQLEQWFSILHLADRKIVECWTPYTKGD
jgi:hypothetical protein